MIQLLVAGVLDALGLSAVLASLFASVFALDETSGEPDAALTEDVAPFDSVFWLVGFAEE